MQRSNPLIDRAALAEERAASTLTEGNTAPTESRFPPRQFVAVGDPQAPAWKFFRILERHGLLNDEGWLREEIGLVSIGDHFDFGPFAQRTWSGKQGLLILGWLAAHPGAQVILIAGNHDFSRVGELATCDDATFERAAREAAALYETRPVPHDVEAEFVRRHPYFATVESVARDLSTFHTEQRQLVRKLLRMRRFRLAFSRNDVLFTHAGTTLDDLAALEVGARRTHDAEHIAHVINGRLDVALTTWDGCSALSVPDLYTPGSARDGEAQGFLFRRPAQPEHKNQVARPEPRRYDPRRLPLGLAQAVGHVRDAKCRTLLRDWVTDTTGEEGELRTLHFDGEIVRYQRGTSRGSSRDATLYFLDGGMDAAEVENYQLFDVERRSAFSPPS